MRLVCSQPQRYNGLGMGLWAGSGLSEERLLSLLCCGRRMLGDGFGWDGPGERAGDGGNLNEVAALVDGVTIPSRVHEA